MRPLLDAPSQLESLVRRSQDQSLWSVSISASRLHRRRRLAALGIRPQLRTLGGVASMRAQDPASATASCRHVHPFTHASSAPSAASCGEVDLRRPFFCGLVAWMRGAGRQTRTRASPPQAQAPAIAMGSNVSSDAAACAVVAPAHSMAWHGDGGVQWTRAQSGRWLCWPLMT